MEDINKKIKKAAKKAAKNIVDELDANGWFISSSNSELGSYEKELKTIIKKACNDVVKNGYKKDMVEDVIKETVDIASKSISRAISLSDDVFYDSYRENLKSHVKEVLKSCDKLRESKREERARAVIEEIKSRPGYNPGRVIFSSTGNQQTESAKEKYYAISETKLIELISDQNKLNALECGGVDNWPYYSESQHEYVSEYKEYEDLDDAFAAYSKKEIENNSGDYMPIRHNKLAEATYSPIDEEEELDR